MAIEIAQELECEIISSDSRQFYRELSIGSAPPSAEELKQVKHHFILDRSVTEELNAASFAQEAIGRMAELFQDFDHLVMVGGSGLYLKGIIEGFDEIPKVKDQEREKLNTQLLNEGIESLQAELLDKDPNYYREVDIHNPQRLIRALEVIRSTGKTFSSFRQKSKNKLPYQVLLIGLEEERSLLYERINKRVDLMLEAGLENEARLLEGQQQLSSLQTVGYKEFFAYFRGEWSYDQCVEEIKKNSRRYAKRQITWFRRIEEMQWFHRSDKSGILKLIKGE